MAVGGATGAEGPGFGGIGVSGSTGGTAGGGASAGFGGASTPGSISGIGSSAPGVSATGADIGGDTGLGSGWGGFFGAFRGGKFGHQDPTFLGQTPYGRGLQAGHAVGLLGSALSMVTSMGLSEVALAGKGMIGHATALGQLSGQPGGFAGTAPGDMGMGGGPDITESPTPKKPTPAPRPAPEPAPAPKVTPYTETKEYLGGQERLRSLQGEINRLGAELEAIQAKRKALEPKRRKMVGRIPLVHTELGGAEPKALTPEKRERMLMSHSIPKNARRRGGA